MPIMYEDVQVKGRNADQKNPLISGNKQLSEITSTSLAGTQPVFT